MRYSINGAWLFGIIITFMAILIAFITISINYSRAYEMKTKMVTTIEQYDGVTPMTIDALNQLTNAYGYTKTNACKSENHEKVVGILSGVPTLNPKTPQNVCITREYLQGCVNPSLTCVTEDKYYYTVEVFFGFNLPLFGNIFTFRVEGETNAVNYPGDNDLFN